MASELSKEAERGEVKCNIIWYFCSFYLQDRDFLEKFDEFFRAALANKLNELAAEEEEVVTTAAPEEGTTVAAAEVEPTEAEEEVTEAAKEEATESPDDSVTLVFRVSLLRTKKTSINK